MVPKCLRAIRKMPVASMPLLSSRIPPHILTGVVEGCQRALVVVVVVEVEEDAREGSVNLSHR